MLPEDSRGGICRGSNTLASRILNALIEETAMLGVITLVDLEKKKVYTFLRLPENEYMSISQNNRKVKAEV